MHCKSRGYVVPSFRNIDLQAGLKGTGLTPYQTTAILAGPEPLSDAFLHPDSPHNVMREPNLIRKGRTSLAMQSDARKA